MEAALALRSFHHFLAHDLDSQQAAQGARVAAAAAALSKRAAWPKHSIFHDAARASC